MASLSKIQFDFALSSLIMKRCGEPLKRGQMFACQQPPLAVLRQLKNSVTAISFFQWKRTSVSVTPQWYFLATTKFTSSDDMGKTISIFLDSFLLCRPLFKPFRTSVDLSASVCSDVRREFSWGSFIQCHMVVLCLWCAVFVTS